MNPLPPLKTFIIYSSKDRELRQQLESHLQALVDLKWIALWSDKEIAPGERWDTAIKNQLAQADLFLMLVSVDFYNSGYIREEEFKTAVERMERGDSIVVPIIARPCDWEVYPVIKDLQVLPPGGEAVTDTDHWKDREKAWTIVAKKLRERIHTLREGRKTDKKPQEHAAEAPSVAAPLPFEPTMLRIPGGTFQMGQSDPNIGGEGKSKDEQPVHRVTISPFYLANTQTTNAQFCAFLNEKGNQMEGGATWIAL